MVLLSLFAAPYALAYQPGKDGIGTVTTANTVVNQYTAVTANASTGNTILTLASTAGITPGDVLLIYQAQGASIDATDTAAFGNVTGLGHAGSYEFVNVLAVPSGTSVTIASDCTTGLRYNYDANMAQAVRVPQYTTLMVSGTGSIIATPWNGSIGGIVAVFVQGAATIDGAGISTAGQGFRGGVLINNTGNQGTDWPYYRVSPAQQGTEGGAEKGESIAGYQALYDTQDNGRYGRGAPANGGGGGNAHNGGGGGGANGNSGLAWNGQGNPDLSNASWTSAWNLDPTLTAATTSSGGGRGGYTFGSTNQDALTVAPGMAVWGGNLRRERGGLGGRPLTNDASTATSRLFFGGGGGAGDENNAAGTNGANGGGLIYVIAGSVGGGATITADGATATNTIAGNNDAPGGGGGGGGVVINSVTLTGIIVSANGGKGGDQLITNNESEGPGGGGGGGYIAYSGTPAAITVNGGVNGITDSAAVTEFIPNGATKGGAGLTGIVPAINSLPVCAQTASDLSITKTDGSATYTPGTAITYTIVASNAGPAAVTGATVTDTLPATVTGATWTCVAVGGACPASGVGNINASVDLTVGGTATFMLTGTVSSSATGNLTNTATIAVPAGVFDPNTLNNTATDTDTSSPVADLSVSKTDGSATYTPGNPVTYTIVVTNNGPSDVTGATVSDPLPIGIVTANWTCLPSAGSNCTASGVGAIADTVNLKNGGTATYMMTLTVPASRTGNLVNTVTATDPGGTTDPNGNNNTATDTDTPSPVADLAVTKTDGSATYTPGNPVTYTIVVTNNGPSDVTGATVSDPLPIGIVTANWTCLSSAGSSCTASGVGAIADTVNLKNSGTATYMLTLTVPASRTGNLVNTVTATDPAGNTDPNGNNNTATDTDTPSPVADLAVTKTDGSATYTPGNPVTYTIVVTNNGPSDVTGAAVSDPLPLGIVTANWTCLPSAGSNCTASGVGAIADTVNLKNGGTATYMMTLTVPASRTGNLVNTVTATDPVGKTDPNGNNNTATDTDAQSANITMAKVGPATVQTSGALIYTINLGNSGGTASGSTLTVADVLPTGVTYVSAAAGTNVATVTCTGATTLSCTVTLTVALPAGAANGAATFTITTTAPSTSGSITNYASVDPTGGPTSPTPGAGCAPVASCGSATTMVNTPAGITLAKAGPATVQTNGALVYTISLGNGGGTASGTTLTVADVLPAGVTYVSAAAGTNVTSVTCTGATTLSCTFNLTAALPAGAANGAATFTITTTAPNTAGSVTNYASVDPTGGPTPPTPGAGCTPAASCGSATTTVNTPANITMRKTGPATVQTNGALIYTISLGNSGGTASGTTLTVADVLPPGVTYVSAAAGTNVTSVACLGATTLSCMVNLTAALAAGAANGAGTFTITTTAPNTAGSITNFASVDPTGGTNPPTPGVICIPATSCGSATTTVSTPAGITLAKTGPATVQTNGALIYTISLGNGGGTASGTMLTVADVLPAGVNYVSATAGTDVASVTCTGATTLSCTVNLTAVLPAGAVNGAATFTITTTAPSTAGSIANYASVDPTGGPTPPTPGAGCTPAASCGSATTTVTAPARITLAKAGPATVQTNAALIYTISLGNGGGTVSGTTLTVADVLPTGVTYVSAAAGTNVTTVTCTGATTLSCTVNLTAGLPAGATNGAATFTITTTAPSTTGSITNYASVDPTGGTTPPTPGAGCTPAASCGSATTTVNAITTAFLQITKSGPATATAGGNIVYTITVKNTGLGNATNAMLSDPTPAGLTFVSAGAPCAAGFPCLLGTITAGQTLTIPAVTFAIPSSYGGTIVNTASVTSDQTTQTSSTVSAVVSAGGGPLVSLPIDARWMLLAMMALLAGIGARHARVRR